MSAEIPFDGSHDRIKLTDDEERDFQNLANQFEPKPKHRKRRGTRLALLAAAGATAATAAVTGYILATPEDASHHEVAQASSYSPYESLLRDPNALRELGICAIELQAQKTYIDINYAMSEERRAKELQHANTALETVQKANLPCIQVKAQNHSIDYQGRVFGRQDVTGFELHGWCRQRKELQEASSTANEFNVSISNDLFSTAEAGTRTFLGVDCTNYSPYSAYNYDVEPSVGSQ